MTIMNIKKNFYIMLSALSLMTFAGACDNIAEDDRFITENKPIPDPHSVPKTLLIQEFTGVRCTNCPDAAKIITSIQERNPGRVISVGLHAVGGGKQTRPWSDHNFLTDEAQVLYAYYRPSALPAAVFNGVYIDKDKNLWPTDANVFLKDEANMTIELNSSYSENTREVSMDYEITLTGDLSGDLNLMVWLTESGIVGLQSTATTTLRDYVHNHVLRKSFFDTQDYPWGKSLGSSFKNGDKIRGSVSTNLNEDWVAENCNVIVFVQRADNKIVEQSAEVAVIEDPETPAE